MSALAVRQGGGVAASVLESVAAWLVEPAAARDDRPVPIEVARRPVIAVAGLHRGAGVTVIARAVGVALAARDPAGVGVVSGSSSSRPLSVANLAAGRLTRALGPLVLGSTQAVGRLCIVEGAEPASLATHLRGLAPLVIDVADPSAAAAGASLADAVVLVGSPATEPALAAVAAERLAVVGPPPVVVINRMSGVAEAPALAGAFTVPASRVSAHAVAGGRVARGAFGTAITLLVDRLEGY